MSATRNALTRRVELVQKVSQPPSLEMDQTPRNRWQRRQMERHLRRQARESGAKK